MVNDIGPARQQSLCLNSSVDAPTWLKLADFAMIVARWEGVLMSDEYGKGRWSTGSRPLMPGPAQSDYDRGVQDRMFEERRREQEQRDYYERQRKEQQKRQEEERKRLAERYNSQPSHAPAADDDQPVLHNNDDPSFDDMVLLAGTAAIVYLMVRIWGMATGSLNPTNAILAGIVDHGAWGVGLAGIGLSIRFQELLLPVAKVVLTVVVVGAVLFFGSAIVVGIYRGVTG